MTNQSSESQDGRDYTELPDYDLIGALVLELHVRIGTERFHQLLGVKPDFPPDEIPPAPPVDPREIPVEFVKLWHLAHPNDPFQWNKMDPDQSEPDSRPGKN